MENKTAIPRDAATIILFKDDKVYLAQRNPKIPFMGGWYAFSGGKVDAGDAEITVKNCEDSEIARFLVAAVRETFEETGILLVHGGEKLTRGQRTSLHDDLLSGRSTFREILESWGLWIDAEDFNFAGHWTTPAFSPVRFRTRFFAAACPPKQTPTTFGEMITGDFFTPVEALEHWEKGEILISPPVLISLKELAENNLDATPESVKTVAEKLTEKSKYCDGSIDYIELNSHIICAPLKTATLPPATHTNCFIVGRREFIVIDAASPDETEQEKLHALIDSFIEKGCLCKEIIVTHLHPDHFGGESALQKHLQEKFGLDIPVSAHKLTVESLEGKASFQKHIEDGDVYQLKDENGKAFELKALHTPGHARGHLAFYDEEKGFLLSSDNVISTGSVVIAPPEGNMSDYLATLERLKNLPNLRFLCGSHGAAVYDAKGKIEEYITHRLERERLILEAINCGAKTTAEIVEKVYIGLKPELIRLAEKSVEAHLENLKADGKI